MKSRTKIPDYITTPEEKRKFLLHNVVNIRDHQDLYNSFLKTNLACQYPAYRTSYNSLSVVPTINSTRRKQASELIQLECGGCW